MSAQITCCCCDERMELQFSASPLDYCLDKRFEVYQCPNCGHGSTQGITGHDLETVYEGGAYDPKEKPWHKILRPALNLLESTKVDYVKSSVGKGKVLLEVGTGKGNFLLAALNAGYEAYGIEPSSRSYSLAKLKLGERVHHCALEDIHTVPALNRKYDCIFLWHVLEHLGSPEHSIKLLGNYLKPDGVLIFGVPNFESYQSRRGRSNWYHLDPPRHLSHFTRESAKLILAKCAMKVHKIIHNSFFQDYLGEIITFTNGLLPQKNIILNVMRFNGYYFSRFNKGSRAVNLLACLLLSSIVSIPMLLVTLVSQWLGKSGTMVVVAKRSET